MITLKNCRLISELTEDYDDVMADILLDGKVIREINAPGTGTKGETVMDLEGKTVMPGLFDLHMHFNFDTVNVYELRARGESQALLNGISYGYQYLRNGYTTVRDCGCMYYLGVYLRDAYASGLLMGPRVITAGACNSPSAMGNSAFGPVYKEFNGPHEAWEVARTDIAAGADFVKYMVTGAVMNKGGDPGAMICTREELHVLSDVAKSLNTYVAAHCHGKEGIMACAEEEIGTIEHASYIDDECIEALLAHGNVTAVIPTLSVAYSMAKNITGNTPDFMRERSLDVMENIHQNMGKAYRAGVRMGWGSDADRDTFSLQPGLEFKARKEFMDLSNVELLRQATIDSARIVHLDSQVGTVKVGKLADLICVDGNPDQDISAMYRLPAYVWKEGKLFV